MQSNFNWAEVSQQMTAPEAVTELKDLSKIAIISGYIAGRKNALSQDINVEQAKAAFEAAKAEALAKNPNGIQIDEIDTNGEKTAKQVVINSESKYTKKNLRSLNYDAYLKASKGVYRAVEKEAKAEFITVCLPERFDVDAAETFSSNTEIFVADKARAKNPNNSVFLLREKDLVVAMLAAETQKLNAVELKADGSRIEKGFVVPSMKISARTPKKNPNSVRYIKKLIYVDADSRMKVRNIGDLGLPYAVNRNYVGNTPADLAAVTNKDKFNEKFPNVDVMKLGTTKPAEKLTGGKSQREMEEIPFKTYADAYAKMRVTPAMLDQIRTSGSSTSKEYDASRIAEEFQSSTAVFRQYRSANAK